MRIEVDDVEGIMEQVARIAPPAHREDHRFLNSLRKLLEKNVVVNPSAGIQELAEKSEQRDLAVSALSFMRRDTPLETRRIFAVHIKEAEAAITRQEEKVRQRKETHVPRYVPADDGSSGEIEKIVESISAVMGKLERAKLVVEDAHSKSVGRCLEPSSYAENFFRSV
jgi:hypothetical protein